MSDRLAEICARKAEHVAQCKARLPLAQLQPQAEQAPPTRGFFHALQSRAQSAAPALICEIKKASPSKGLIRQSFDPAAHARDYEQAGATCLSVLTDAPYFQGDDTYLAAARHACHLPTLRKDFMIDPYQIYESRALGADAILLIMAALSDAQAQEMETIAHQLSMDALIEVHDEHELERALTHLKSPLIGINNRNLKTLEVDLATSLQLRPLLPPHVLSVCESGIRTRADIDTMMRADIHCFLVGESLMSQPDILCATRHLIHPQ